MFERWVADGDVHGRADIIEVCNSPTASSWPERAPRRTRAPLESRFEVARRRLPGQLPPTSRVTMQTAVAEMMQTVDDPRPLVLAHVAVGPSTATIRRDGQRSLSPEQQVRRHALQRDALERRRPRLLDELDRIGFRGGDHSWWSFHNYNDWERGQDRACYLGRC